MAVLMSEHKAKEVAAENTRSEDYVIDGAWSYDAVPAGSQKCKALLNGKLIDEMPLSAANLWVVEVYDEGGEYLGTL